MELALTLQGEPIHKEVRGGDIHLRLMDERSDRVNSSGLTAS